MASHQYTEIEDVKLKEILKKISPWDGWEISEGVILITDIQSKKGLWLLYCEERNPKSKFISKATWNPIKVTSTKDFVFLIVQNKSDKLTRLFSIRKEAFLAYIERNDIENLDEKYWQEHDPDLTEITDVSGYDDTLLVSGGADKIKEYNIIKEGAQNATATLNLTKTNHVKDSQNMHGPVSIDLTCYGSSHLIGVTPNCIYTFNQERNDKIEKEKFLKEGEKGCFTGINGRKNKCLIAMEVNNRGVIFDFDEKYPVIHLGDNFIPGAIFYVGDTLWVTGYDQNLRRRRVRQFIVTQEDFYDDEIRGN